MDFVFGVWDGVKDNAELLLYKWNSAMKNHAKDGNRNKYAEELLIYVLCAYIVLGALVMLIVALIFFGVIKPFETEDLKKKAKEDEAKRLEDDKGKKKKKPKYFTAEMVAGHNTPDDLWIVVDNKVYDVTQYLVEHPGGEEALLNKGGKDATAGFKGPQHPSRVEVEIEDYFIGHLLETKKAK